MKNQNKTTGYTVKTVFSHSLQLHLHSSSCSGGEEHLHDHFILLLLHGVLKKKKKSKIQMARTYRTHRSTVHPEGGQNSV